MFFIYGLRWTTRVLGQISYFCSPCGKQTFHTASVVRGWFTLFIRPHNSTQKEVLDRMQPLRPAVECGGESGAAAP